MNLEELVQRIVQEVLNRLQDETPRIVVLAERDATLALRVQERLAITTDVTFWNETNAEDSSARYILPFLGCSDMAGLASGRAENLLISHVLRLILAGKKVEVLEFEYRQYRQTAPHALYTMYESYEVALSKFGMLEAKSKKPDTLRYDKNLVTENIVFLARDEEASTLLVPASAVVTPLAAEAAKDLQISILKQL